MGHPSSDKGKRFERNLVKQFKKENLIAERMYGSDGTHVGLGKNVDIVVESSDGEQFGLQCKHFKETPKYLQLYDGTDGSVIKQDLREPVVVLSLTTFIKLLKKG